MKFLRVTESYKINIKKSIRNKITFNKTYWFNNYKNMDELSFNTPLFSKDKEYAECEYCDGDGYVIVNTHEFKCPNCNGAGQIEINE